MLFAPDTEWSLRAAVELINSAGQPDTLTSLDDVDAWWKANRYTGRRDRDAAELRALRTIRAELRALLSADRDAAAEIANRMLAAARALPQLVRHDDLDWHVHAISATFTVVGSLTTASASCSTSRATTHDDSAPHAAQTATPRPPTEPAAAIKARPSPLTRPAD